MPGSSPFTGIEPIDQGRAERMLTVLLAATDPAGIVAQGHSPEDYAPLAKDVVKALRAGADTSRLLTLVAETSDVEAAAAFARSAVTWWEVDAARENPFRVASLAA